MTPDYKFISSDPVKWIQRLREVNEGSRFTQDAKDLIEDKLKNLERKLERLS